MECVTTTPSQNYGSKGKSRLLQRWSDPLVNIAPTAFWYPHKIQLLFDEDCLGIEQSR